ncbi:hypothetical protein GC387_02605 [Pseudomonas sp. MWU12-2323]|nr:hypothetical protein [Pseudomonas sp. MWU12-2323]
MLAMGVNDNAGYLVSRGARTSIASKLAPTEYSYPETTSRHPTRVVTPDTTLAAIPSVHDPCRISLFIASHPPAGL